LPHQRVLERLLARRIGVTPIKVTGIHAEPELRGRARAGYYRFERVLADAIGADLGQPGSTLAPRLAALTAVTGLREPYEADEAHALPSPPKAVDLLALVDHVSGAQIARSVSDVVLVRDDFAVVPGMIAEGRQILRNIQRVARLFITKTVFTAVVGLAVAIPTGIYPLLPRQSTIASTVTIGIPAFLQALAPSTGPWRPERFLYSVARFAIPAGLRSGSGSSPAPSSPGTESISA
jgi:hypothetical protein